MTLHEHPVVVNETPSSDGGGAGMGVVLGVILAVVLGMGMLWMVLGGRVLGNGNPGPTNVNPTVNIQPPNVNVNPPAQQPQGNGSGGSNSGANH